MKPLLTLAALALVSTPVLADTGHGHDDDAASGEAVARTIGIKAGSMWFEPSRLTIEPGTTVRFRITNVAMIPHEFSIGSASLQRRHREMMQQTGGHHGTDEDHGHMAGEGHGNRREGASVTIAPGATETLVWTAPEQGDRIGYACFIAGHQEAGMAGTVMLGPAS